MMAQSQARFLKEQKANKLFLSHLRRMVPGSPAPKMSKWAKRIDRGTRPRTIVDNIWFKVRKMGGEISKSGFTSFITSGFYNTSIFDQPGGFTTLMFWPKEDKHPLESIVKRKRCLRELFGPKICQNRKPTCTPSNNSKLLIHWTSLSSRFGSPN